MTARIWSALLSTIYSNYIVVNLPFSWSLILLSAHLVSTGYMMLRGLLTLHVAKNSIYLVKPHKPHECDLCT